jgi:hypothetical protein
MIPDPAFHFDVNSYPDSAFHSNADPDPPSLKVIRNCEHWSTDSPGLHFEPPWPFMDTF